MAQKELFAENLPKVYPLPRQKPRPLDYALILLLGDLFWFLLAYFGAVSLRTSLTFLFSSLPFFDFERGLMLLKTKWWLFAPLFFALAVRRLYDRCLPFWEEVKEILIAVFWSTIAIYALVSLKKISSEVSRLTIGFCSIFLCFFLPFGRFYTKKFLHNFKRYTSSALIFGAGKTGRALASALQNDSYLGYRVVGFLDDDSKLYGRIFSDLKVFGPIKQLTKFVRLMNVETIFITGSSFSPRRLAEIYSQSQRFVKEIYIVPEFWGLGMLNAESSCLFPQRMFVLRVRNNLLHPLNRYFKRITDLTLVALMLPFVLPLMALLALLIKLDSPGPVFFKHRRVGENGKIFYLWKFRTMYVNGDEILKKYLQKNPRAAKEWLTYRKLREEDPRVTRIGRFLRRYSLDELPQIFNILKGEMALVGPRPVTEEECREYYREKATFYLAVKPGLTGLWQVSGRNLLPYEERVNLDVWYVLNWSLWLDLIILVRTVGTVISQRGSF